MDRREDSRYPRRIQVRFWTGGIRKPSLGYTMNVSSSGMYITTNRVLPRGTRLRVELSSGDGSGLMVEAVVARSDRPLVQQALNTMGVRFLTPRELVSELVPEIAATPPQTPSRSPEGVYRLAFADHAHFLAAYRRDLSTGALFVPTEEPAPLHADVTVEISVPEAAPIRLEGRVVHRFELGEGNLLAGMGLELTSPEEALESLRVLAASIEQGPSSGAGWQ
jgi:Tfp pilus assembly protein PilZ